MKRSLQLAEKAANQDRTGGRFVKSKPDTAVPALRYRSPPEHAQSTAEALRERNAKLQADHNTSMAAQTAEHLLAMQKLLDERDQKNKDLRTLRKKLQQAPATTMPILPKRPNRKILGGSTRQTRLKLAAQPESQLSFRSSQTCTFRACVATPDRLQLHYQHGGLTDCLSGPLYKQNPAWLSPTNRRL
jgi:hypothetical protein